jgi:hypothetical protein
MILRLQCELLLGSQRHGVKDGRPGFLCVGWSEDTDERQRSGSVDLKKSQRNDLKKSYLKESHDPSP